MRVLLIILILGVLLVGLAFVEQFGPFKKAPKDKAENKKHIDVVREAAFAVIEASLEAVPKKWRPYLIDGEVYWLVNDEARTAIWIANSPANLYITDKTGKGPMQVPHDRDRMYPPRALQNSIFKAAMEIVNGIKEEKEQASLVDMVNRFAEITKKEADNDQAAA